MDTTHTNIFPTGRPDSTKEENALTEKKEERLQKEEEIYPVQQVGVTEPVTAKEVKDAVRELNPDCNSLESR